MAGVLEAGEEVYWQEQPPRKPLLFPTVVLLAILGGIAWQEALLENPSALLQGAPLPALVFLALFPVVIIYGFVGIDYYRRDSTVYALTSQRVMRVFKGTVVQQATPEKLQLRGSPVRGSVRWHNVDLPPDSQTRGRYGFANVEDGHAVHQLLDDWQQTKVREYDDRAEASSQAFRNHAASGGAEPRTSAGTQTPKRSATEATAASVRKITHPEYGFSLDVPAQWDLQVGQEHDGPFKILGLTLIRRIVRPAELRPYQPGDDSPLGFGTLPLPVISRQWWLSGHGLDLELQGIAPVDSTELQQTVDLAVGSLRPEND